MDLVLIRHPAVRVDAGVCYGQTDVPLLRDVNASACALKARMLSLNVPACVDGWHSSGLVRCASLASALSGGIAPHVDARLAEMNFGAWEGRAWDAIDRALIDAWAADIEHARPHGGESLVQFAGRVEAWLRDIERADRPVHVIAHAGVMRVLTAHMLGMERASVLQWPIEFGAIVQFRRVRGKWLLVRWNA
ncbi:MULTISPECIES: alpha-ribazole phosphatase family protein [unclassified Caballeronia]|uniref:alpha-ribazole phosphatase family protein n=1 Tax=unclassified Caballeronia TaxID=2646786 RepID=UPI0020294478|nr:MULTISPECIES: alpha-ribazole phosphatase family protein [unclassified Caballeronia]